MFELELLCRERGRERVVVGLNSSIIFMSVENPCTSSSSWLPEVLLTCRAHSVTKRDAAAIRVRRLESLVHLRIDIVGAASRPPIERLVE
jgi:hypothetical protein